MNNQHQYQHRKIIGYRDLTQEEINLMNRIKGIGKELEKLIDEVEHTNLVIGSTSELDEIAEPQMWTNQAKINLKIGLMVLTRAVAKPTSF